ncbi:hypothetical protein D9V32_04685 [Mycetocola tolaasinivorans]|uniref:C4-type zinc ribbon domain-containing protein n=1 Tax=Mycetocola tolaasinivorans TaxID=76635 RepID=A0A3L7A9B7_9MICO|nr:C4-type zinc ribbon domain-containing protein [Mycetocola tolaasinivorans]RLP76929.1 hypothetical protein D9V32_04685 [Mycetocola tolaasinivorans]
MKATAAAQAKLLELQTIDAEIIKLGHRRNSLPELAALASLEADRDAARGTLARDLGTFEDVRVELDRLEADSAVVDARIARDNALIESGSSNPQALSGIQAELESLRVRRSVLDEAQLISMEAVEAAQGVLDASREAESVISGQIETVEASRDESLEVIAEAVSEQENLRGNLVVGIDEPLLALYDRVRVRGGVGAALFRLGACGACKIASTGNELEAVRNAGLDEVLQCPECSAIMVRTEESGLWGPQAS